MLSPEEKKQLEKDKAMYEDNMSKAIDKRNQDMYLDNEKKWKQCKQDLGEEVEENQDQDKSCEK